MLNRRNLVILEGNLVRDPEIHELKSGAKVVHFTIAINGAASGSGEKDSSGFFDCKFWLTQNDYTPAAAVNLAAEAFSTNRWPKGTKVEIWGRLVQERWGEGDQKRSKTIVSVEQINEVFARKTDSSTTAVDPATGETTVVSSEPVYATASSTIPTSF